MPGEKLGPFGEIARPRESWISRSTGNEIVMDERIPAMMKASTDVPILCLGDTRIYPQLGSSMMPFSTHGRLKYAFK
jgi:hypothetical protein